MHISLASMNFFKNSNTTSQPQFLHFRTKLLTCSSFNCLAMTEIGNSLHWLRVIVFALFLQPNFWQRFALSMLEGLALALALTPAVLQLQFNWLLRSPHLSQMQLVHSLPILTMTMAIIIAMV